MNNLKLFYFTISVLMLWSGATRASTIRRSSLEIRPKQHLDHLDLFPLVLDSRDEVDVISSDERKDTGVETVNCGDTDDDVDDYDDEMSYDSGDKANNEENDYVDSDTNEAEDLNGEYDVVGTDAGQSGISNEHLDALLHFMISAMEAKQPERLEKHRGNRQRRAIKRKTTKKSKKARRQRKKTKEHDGAEIDPEDDHLFIS